MRLLPTRFDQSVPTNSGRVSPYIRDPALTCTLVVGLPGFEPGTS